MTYKKEFIDFLVECNALRFGSFQLKSGRIAPYFINTGMFDTGFKIKKLGVFYAKAIKEHFGDSFDGIYGPAYKGIPLCVSAVSALSDMGMDKGYVFNRKEAKNYGEKSAVVGMALTPETRLVLVDDVITSGKAIRESLEILKSSGNPNVVGIIISVNREEKGKTNENAMKEIQRTLNIPVYSIAGISDIKTMLYNRTVNGKVVLNDEMLAAIDEYLEEYGAQ